MSALREASTASARMGAHPLLSVERLFASERIAAGLEARRIERVSVWDELVDRASAGPATLSPADLRRLLAGIWSERAHAGLAAPIVERAVAFGRRSVDRAILSAYLLDHPVDHRAFAALRAAAAVAADRHDWGWREAGRRWCLWEGPDALGAAIREAAEPSALLREAGFVGRLADGAFVSAARTEGDRRAGR